MPQPTSQNDTPPARHETPDQLAEPLDRLADVRRSMEGALLNGMLTSPAGLVLELARRIEPTDVFPEPVRIVYAAILSAAQLLKDCGETDSVLSPARVQLDLQASGALARAGVADVLLQAASAQYLPPSWPDLVGLADGLKHQRLRREMDTTGRALMDAAQGSNQEIEIALAGLERLETVARRAGVVIEHG